MKKYLFAGLVTLIICLFYSCGLQTLHPIFTEKDLVFDNRLLGNWKTVNGTIISYTRATKKDLAELPASIQENADKVYLLTKKEKDGTVTKYYAFLVKLGKNNFFDYYPCAVDKTGKADEFFTSHFVRMHSISRVHILNTSSIRVAEFEDDYLKKLIKQKNIRIRHEVDEDGNYFITASTAELQQYILKYADVPEAYGSPEGEAYTRVF